MNSCEMCDRIWDTETKWIVKQTVGVVFTAPKDVQDMRYKEQNSACEQFGFSSLYTY